MNVLSVVQSGSKGREDITVSGQRVPVEVYRTDGFPTLFAGFQVAWLDIESEDGSVKAELNGGAGVGSPYFTLRVEDAETGEVTYEYVDMAKWFRDRVQSIVDETRATAAKDVRRPITLGQVVLADLIGKASHVATPEATDPADPQQTEATDPAEQPSSDSGVN